MSIWIPKTVQEAIDMASLLNPSKPHDLLLLHASFGSLFGGDMGLVAQQGFVLRGKPCLSADAMAGVARRSGLVDYLRITSWSTELCELEAKRTDEDKPQFFTFSMEMARAQGLTNNRNWRSMPRQMLRARAMTLCLRALFPDAVSGVYSVDEIADNTAGMNDVERAALTAQSLGEELPKELPSRSPQAVAPPSLPPQPQPQPQQPQPASVNKLWDFSDGADMARFMAEWGIDADAAAAALDNARLNTISDREAFSYGRLASLALISSDAPPDWYNYSNDQVDQIHRGLVAQYGALSTMRPSFYGARLTAGAWMEAMKLVSSFMDDQKIASGLQILRSMHPLDWSSYDRVKQIDAQVTKSEVEQHKAKLAAPSQADQDEREAQRLQDAIDSDETI